MAPGFDQITHGLLVGGIALPVLSGLIGVGVSLLTRGAVRTLTATRLIFVALGIGVAGTITSGTIPRTEAVACLVAQVFAWLVLIGPQRKKKR